MVIKIDFEKYMAIKIDFEKAYDRLRWNFIQDTLLEIRFPQLLVEVIMQCITTSSMKVLWNRDPIESFTASRGIRQGDPLFLYLFVLCMERLNQVIEEYIIAENENRLELVELGLLYQIYFLQMT